MAISWLSALKLVPWSDVISNAPLVADGAKKLWGAVVKPGVSPASSANAASDAGSDDGSVDQRLQHLHAEVASLSAALTDLHSQMVESSALIQALAEQNAQLVAQAQATRVHLRWLAGLAGVALLTAAACLVWVLTGSLGRS